MENTIENKAKFFAKYLNQKVLLIRGDLFKLTFLFLDKDDVQRNKLSLKPLSSLSDEDAQKCGMRNAVELLAMNDGIYMSYSLGSKLIDLGYYIGEHIGENYPLEYGWVRLSE